MHNIDGLTMIGIGMIERYIIHSSSNKEKRGRDRTSAWLAAHQANRYLSFNGFRIL